MRHLDCTCTPRSLHHAVVKRLAELDVEPLDPGSRELREHASLLVQRRELEERWGEGLERCAVQARGEACMDCQCPSPRWWLAHEDDYQWLPSSAAIQVSYGRLPTEATWKRVKGYGSTRAPQVPVVTCPPPPHLLVNKDGTPRKEKPKARDVVLAPAVRCEPMRVAYADSEGTIDVAWAVANGVDPALVELLGGTWAEATFELVEVFTVSRDVDLIIIDSTSVLAPKGELDKSLHDKARVAAKASVMGRWVDRHIAAMFEAGLTARYRPTILTTSQVTIHGLGGGMRAYNAPTDGNRFSHALSLDIRMTEKGYTFDAANEHAIRGAFQFEVKKNKAGGSVGATGIINFWVRSEDGHPVGDSDDLATVMDHARKFGEGYILQGRGKALLTLYSGYLPDGSVAFARVGDCERFLSDHPTIYNDLRGRVLERLMGEDRELVVSGAEVAADA